MQFRRIFYSVAIEINNQNELYLANIERIALGQRVDYQASLFVDVLKDTAYSSLLKEKISDGKKSFVLRQVSPTATSAKFGLDLLIALTKRWGTRVFWQNLATWNWTLSYGPEFKFSLSG